MLSLKSYKNKAIVLAVSIATCSTAIAGTDQKETPKCEEVLLECGKYVTALEVERNHLRDVIREKNREISELENNQPSQPWYIYVLVGAASAVIIQGVK
jgi:hypothetical protein